MSLGLILVIILVIFLLGGFSGRFGGPGYGYGHRGNGLIGIILIIVSLIEAPIFIEALRAAVDGRADGRDQNRYRPDANRRPLWVRRGRSEHVRCTSPSPLSSDDLERRQECLKRANSGYSRFKF